MANSLRAARVTESSSLFTRLHPKLPSSKGINSRALRDTDVVRRPKAALLTSDTSLPQKSRAWFRTSSCGLPVDSFIV